MNMDEINNIAFQIIGFAGDGKCDCMEAVEEAKEGNFDAAEELLKKGEEAINQAHEVHTKLLFAEAQNPGSVQPTIMFVHASNHLAIAEWSLEDCRMKVEIYRLLKTK